ncbi:hypothetical protein GCM10010353_66820 [Streptomyces chryseus]|nr:hypothetical protein GCM10010353_66820 [Streptomyces chryseus]
MTLVNTNATAAGAWGSPPGERPAMTIEKHRKRVARELVEREGISYTPPARAEPLERDLLLSTSLL